ncbi:hypothetical protein [Pradoshia sp.]|uniref:hypothetical protein n=1 Tax=Pradoshia sp. TaxID=2651281 RepID=UPI003F077D2A
MNYYELCNRNIGRNVCITDIHGRKHTGVITRVTNKHVWIRPNGGRQGGGYSWGWGWGWGWGYPLALGLIGGFALGALFF